MRKRGWKSIFFDLISKSYKQAGRIGPLESDMMPIALLSLVSDGSKTSVSASKKQTEKTGEPDGKRTFFYVAASQSRAEQCRDDLTAWAELFGLLPYCSNPTVLGMV